MITPRERSSAHRTVFRREDVQSRSASPGHRPCRKLRSRVLQIVPLAIRRLRGPSRDHVILPFTYEPSSVCARCGARWQWWRLEGCPQEAREFARDRHGDLGRWLVVLRQASEAATESLNDVFATYRSESGYAVAQIISPRRLMAAFFMAPLGAAASSCPWPLPTHAPGF